MSAHHGYALDPGLKSLLASVGVRHEDVLRRAGLPEDALNRPQRVSADQYRALIRAIETSVDDPRFPIRLVESVSAESFSPPVFAALCSPNLTAAVQRLAMFKPLIAPIRLKVDSDASGLRVAYEFLGGNPPCMFAGWETLFLVKLARMGTRHDVRATAVTLPQIPAEREAFEAFLGCRVSRGEPMCVRFSAEDARRPFLTDNGAMWDIFEPELRKRLADLEGPATFEARTRAVLVEALPGGQASIDAVAGRLAVSPRTLQRRLQDEGTRFHAVVDDTRKSLSLHYVERTQLSYGEIAYLVGFKEPNSFFRAFQGWTGTTPEAARQSAVANPGPKVPSSSRSRRNR